MKDLSSFRKQLDESSAMMPPNILILRRKSVRQFPDGTMVALYYNDKLDQYFSIPYGDDTTSVVTPTTLKEGEEERKALADRFSSQKERDEESERHRKELTAKYSRQNKEILSLQDEKSKSELNEAPEQLDELKASTLDSYIDKRGTQVRKSVDTRSGNSKFTHFRGLGTAAKKLSYKAASMKEDADILTEDTISHLRKVVKFETNTPVRHNDGTSTKVDPTTASALLAVHDALSDENKRKFAEHLGKSKAHFHKMLDFAWKSVK